MAYHIQNACWALQYYPKKVQWMKSQLNLDTHEEKTFVTLRRSRKGTHLNIAEEFYTKPMENSFIGRIPVLPNGGCCDMEYVLFRQNAYSRKMLSRQDEVYYGHRPHYTPSVTINIGTSPPYNHNYLYPSCQHKVSYSTISINPSIVSEEPWLTKKSIIPLGLHCCENKNACEHAQSKEQRVINLDTLENTTVDERFVYVTAAPRISPLKSCWKFLMCKKKKIKGDTYLPTVMTKNEPHHDCVVCPTCSKNNKNTEQSNPTKNQLPLVPSRLSTITESEITVSEYSSEEFNLPDTKKHKEKRFEPTQKTYTGTGKMAGGPSFTSDRNTISSNYPEGQLYRWICEPTEDRLNNKIGKKQYICYKES